MTYRGAIKNGVVVFDKPVPLEEGTVADVSVCAKQTTPGPEPLSREALERIRDLRWAGDPAELERLIEEVQRDRDNDLMPLDDGGLK